jgi:chromosome segregation ATPase
MRKVDASWKRAIEVVEQIEKCARELNQKHVIIAAEHLKLDDYTAEIKNIIKIRKDASLKLQDIDSTVDDIECNVDELEGYLDHAFTQMENLKDNLKHIKKERW